MTIEIRRLGRDDLGVLMAASHLFDEPPLPEAAVKFLARDSHHLLMAHVDHDPAGFVSGVETTHPDKGTEMFLYELGVDERHRGTGLGGALVNALADLARTRGCYGMWVATEPGNVAAIATYRSAGARSPEEAVVLAWEFPGNG